MADINKIVEKMPSEDDLTNLAELYKVFGDSTRIKILSVLQAGVLSVTEISEVLGMNQSAISHQLQILRANHLVRAERAGKSNMYSLDDNHVSLILSQGLEHISEGNGAE